MAILQTSDQVKTYNKAFATLKDAEIVPYAADAENKYIKKYLGSALYEALEEYVTAEDPEEDTDFDALLPYVLRASSRFTLLVAAPFLDINVGSTGFTTSNTGSLVPASDARVKRFMDGLEKLAWENVETMLQFLEENADDYDLWTASEAYTLATNNFIHTASEFGNLVAMSVNRLLFTLFKAQMDNVEKFKIGSIIPQEIIDEIKQEIIDDDLSEANEAIAGYIKLAIANFTVANVITGIAESQDTSFTLALKADQRSEFDRLGNHYLMEIQKVLDADPDSYPLYVASDFYNEEKTSNDMYEISEDDSVLGFGAIPVK